MRAFLTGSDEGAFAELVRRHGPTVLSVCRRALGPTPDAEDAFQATFLVLVRRARSTEWRDALGPWLYGVALKVARKARAARVKRRTHERPERPMTEPATPPAEPDDAAAVLDEELAALPARYRAPLVLCEIRGASRRDAARELGLTEGTLSSRLARGRKLLRERLARRGVAPAAGGLAVAVPAGLAGATVRHATQTLARAAGAVPVAILSLTEEVTKTMIAKWKLALAAVATCATLTTLGAWNTSAHPAPVSDVSAAVTRADEKKSAPPAKQPAPERLKADDGAERVATIFGDVAVTREQFTEHLIRRYGRRELKLFVNRQIIRTAFTRAGFTLTPEEVQRALDDACAVAKMSREQFAAAIQKETGKTIDVWNEDMNVPTLMLARLAKTKVAAPTEAELRRAFDLRYGEKLDCRTITWNNENEARAAYENVRGSEKEFDAHARRHPQAGKPRSGVAADGRAEPIPRAQPLEDSAAERAVYEAAVKLRPGEVSPLVPVEIEGVRGFVVLKCDRVIPADKTKSFEKERASLLDDVLRAKVNNETDALAKGLIKEAAPKYHLTFPEREPLPKSDPAKK